MNAESRLLRTAAAVMVALVVPATVVAQPDAPPAEPRPRVRMDWHPRPSIRIGDFARVDFRLKLQGDVRSFDQEQDEERLDAFHLQRRRAALEGELFGRVAFEIERELRPDGPWRDVFADVTVARWLAIKGGQFKVPFGLEETTGTTDLDFVFRSLASEAITPGRDVGGIAHGRIRRVLSYEVGVFREDGQNARRTERIFLLPGEPEPAGGRAIAARLVVRPFRGRRENARPRIGIGAVSSQVPEGLNSLFGRSVYGLDFFPRVYTRGRRTRLGAQAEWNPGPFGFRAEYLHARDERKGQGLGNADLSDVVARGWYASATWVVTGERRADRDAPRRSLGSHGFGAIEVGTRFEETAFRSASAEGPAFRHPRADHLVGNRGTVWTTGVNWYANRWTRVQLNGIRERYLDSYRAPVPGQVEYLSAILRLQVVL